MVDLGVVIVFDNYVFVWSFFDIIINIIVDIVLFYVGIMSICGI